MAKRFADRTVVKFNEREIAHVQNGTMNVDFQRTPVQTMNKKRRIPGFVEGNRSITGNFGVAIEENAIQALLEAVDYSAVDVSLSMEFGGETVTLIGVWMTSVAYNAASVGSEVTKAWEFGATDIVNESGSSVTDEFAKGAADASSALAALGI
jgi:hypothetical protein